MNEVALPEHSSALHKGRPHRLDHPRLTPLLPGLGLSVLLAFVAMQLCTSRWLAAHGIGALTAAIGLGILAGNTFYPRLAVVAGAGIGFSKQTLLRAGVILYGLRLTLHDVGQVGVAGILIDALVVTSTFMLSVLLGTRVFRLARETSMLIGAGSAICGAAAVMAAQPVVRGRADDVSLSRAVRLHAAWAVARGRTGLWGLHGLHDSRGCPGVCGRPLGERIGRQYCRHHEDGAGDDARTLPHGTLGLDDPR